jgi:hypothetical protein
MTADKVAAAVVLAFFFIPILTLAVSSLRLSLAMQKEMREELKKEEEGRR